MKLNLPFFKSKTPEPAGMMTQKEIELAHDLLAAIVTGQTPIRFNKIPKGTPNPLKMVVEVLAYVLGRPHGEQVREMILHLKTQLEEGARKHQEQEEALRRIQEGYQPPSNGAV